MSLTKQTVTDKIEVVTAGTYKAIQVREAVQVLEDGEVLSSKYSRYVLMPDADLTGLDSEVVSIANTVFTQDMKDAYTASQTETAE